MRSIKDLLKCFEAELSTAQNYEVRERLHAFLVAQGLVVYGGQKRLVVFDESKRYVYKIACDLFGVQDNINEVACSARLQELAQEGVITHSDLGLFMQATVVDGDPFVIRQEAGKLYDEDANFIDFYNQRNQLTSGNKSTAQIFPIYVAHNERLSREYGRILEIMSAHFVGSDMSVTREPRNYGFAPNSNGLVLFDMGSIVPAFKNVYGQYDFPVCPHCGQHTFKYTPFRLNSSLKDDTITDIGGQYGCINTACDLTISKPGGVIPQVVVNPEQADQNVYGKYMREHMHDVNIMNLIHGYTWMPSNPLEITDMISLRNDIFNTTRGAIDISSAEDMERVWKNYLTRNSSVIISSQQELLSYPVYNGAVLKTYTQFYGEMVQLLSNTFGNIFSNNVIRHLISMLYLRGVALISQKYDMYAAVVEAKVYVEFRNAISSYISNLAEQDMQLLFTGLKGI